MLTRRSILASLVAIPGLLSRGHRPPSTTRVWSGYYPKELLDQRRYYRNVATGEACYRKVRLVPLQAAKSSSLVIMTTSVAGAKAVAQVAQEYGPGYGVDLKTLDSNGKLYPEENFVFAPAEWEVSRRIKEPVDRSIPATQIFDPVEEQISDRSYYRATTGEVCYRRYQWVPEDGNPDIKTTLDYGPGYGVDPVTFNHNGRLYPATEFHMTGRIFGEIHFREL